MSFSRNSFYRKILLGLISFCLVPALAVFFLTYTVYSRSIIDKYASHEIERLNRIQLTNNRIFLEMTETYQDIPTSLDFTYFSNHTFSDDITRFYSFSEAILTRLMNSRYLHSVTLYSQSNGYLWTMAKNEAEEQFSRETSHLKPFGNPENFNRYFYRNHPITGERLISYIYPSFYNGARGNMLFVINISVDTLKRETEKLSDRYNKEVYLSLNNRILPLDGREDLAHESQFIKDSVSFENWSIDGRGTGKRIISKTGEDTAGMTFYSRVELKEYTSDFRSFFIVVFFLFCLFLLISLFLAIYYSRYLYTPMNKLLHTLSGSDLSENRIDEFQLIMSKYNVILENNQDLQIIVDANELIMRDRFLENLLKGHYDSEENIEAGLKRFRIPLSPVCCVINCYVENRHELMKESWSHWLQVKSRLQNLARETLDEFDNIIGLTCEFSGDEIVILLSFPQRDEEERIMIRESFLADFMERCHPAFSEKIHLGVGNLTHELILCDESYRHSVMALRLGLLPGDQRVHHFPTDQLIENRAVQTGKHLNRFINLVKLPLITTQESVLDDFLDETIEDWGTEMKPNSGFSSYLRFVITITEYMETQFGIYSESYLGESPYMRITQCQTIGEIRLVLKEFLSGCLTILKEKQEEAGTRGKKVRLAEEYINKNYGDLSLNLTKVADMAGLNPSYMSRIFSQERGQSFQDFLSEVRLGEAKKLIINTSLPLYQVSEKVGFGSVLSFSRAFKKWERCTPKEYRENFK